MLESALVTILALPVFLVVKTRKVDFACKTLAFAFAFASFAFGRTFGEGRPSGLPSTLTVRSCPKLTFALLVTFAQAIARLRD